MTAAEFGKGVGLIANELKGSAGASFDFSGIVTTYGHLRVVVYPRGDTAATTTTLLLRFNNDSGANYDTQRLSGIGATAASAEQFGQTSSQLGNIPAASATADAYAGYVIDIPHYAGSADHKVAIANGAVKFGTSTGNLEVRTTASFWRSTAQITRITLLPGAGNFDAGSRCSIYAFGD